MGSFTPEDQAIVDELQKVCDGHRDRTTVTLRQCALLRQQELLKTQIAVEADARKKADEIQAATIRLQGQRQQALAFISEQMDAIKTTGLQINGALWKATSATPFCRRGPASRSSSTSLSSGSR